MRNVKICRDLLNCSAGYCFEGGESNYCLQVAVGFGLGVAAQRGTLWDSPQLMEIARDIGSARLEAQTLTVQSVPP
ncbi:hypothetical protein MAN88_35760 [Microcystis aeruginosa]|nr:hypothetical protein MAN88_35760 [Microcystis aeruginosa]